MLHQPFLVGLEGVELLGLRGDEVVEVGEAVGDAALFGQRSWKEDDDFANHCRRCMAHLRAGRAGMNRMPNCLGVEDMEDWTTGEGGPCTQCQQ